MYTGQIWWSIGATIVVTITIYFLLGALKGFNKKLEVSMENAKAALDRIYNWLIWMMGIQTAALAAIILLLKDKSQVVATEKMIGSIKRSVTVVEPLAKPYMIDWAIQCFVLFGLAMILTTTLFSAISSMQQRLVADTSEDNDIYLLDLYTGLPIKSGRVLTIIHLYFVAGLICFGVLAFLLYGSEGCK